MTPIPNGAPQSLGEAFAHINALSVPSVDDLKVMVLIEAAGQPLYEASAEGSDHEEVKALLIENGHEEMKRLAAQRPLSCSGEVIVSPDKV